MYLQCLCFSKSRTKRESNCKTRSCVGSANQTGVTECIYSKMKEMETKREFHRREQGGRREATT